MTPRYHKHSRKDGLLSAVLRRVLPSSILLFLSVGSAQESLVDLPLFRQASQALADQRFDTAAKQFRECLPLVASHEKEEAPEGDLIVRRMLEALVRNGETGEAVAWVLGNQPFSLSPATHYWIALAFQAEERYSEAAESYEIYIANSGTIPQSTRINYAVCLARSGRHEMAVELIQELHPETPQEAICLARIADLATFAPSEKVALASPESPNEPTNFELRLDEARLAASARMRVGNRDGALEVLYHLVDQASDEEEARRAFVLTEVFLDGARPPSLSLRFAEWQEKDALLSRETVMLFRCILLEDEPMRSAQLRAFLATLSEPNLRVEAAIRLGEAVEVPVSLPRDLHERLDFAVASTYVRNKKFPAAIQHFARMAEDYRGESASRALFNAAVTGLRAGDFTEFTQFESELAARNPHSTLVADLLFLGGLYEAAHGLPDAFTRLTHFVHDFPEDLSCIDAQLTLAEIHLNQAPARSHDARLILDQLRSKPLTLEQSERLDYIALWTEVVERKAPEILRRSEDFGANWPASKHRAEVLMILGIEQYLRRDLAAAATTFRRIADQIPESSYAEEARFFQAKTQPELDEALALWKQIVTRNGPFADQAAHEMALLLVSFDRFDEAQVQFDELMKRLTPDRPLFYAVQADSAWTSYMKALARAKDADLLSAAAELFASLSYMEKAPASWRYNAAVRRGKCLEALGKSSVALEIYQSIVGETRSNSPSVDPSPEETEWVFRAGFSAIHLLSSQENWRSAISIADTLAEKVGSRSFEASRLAEALRLKHWIWD